MIIDPVNADASPEVQMNEGFETLEWGAVYGKRPSLTTGLTWAYYGGRWSGFSVSAGTFTLSNNTTNYIVVDKATGVASCSSSSTNWDDTTTYARVYKVTTASGLVTLIEDHRAGPYGIHAGIPGTNPITWRQTDSGSPQSDYFVLTDAENGVAYNESSACLAVMPANADVAFPIGTSILLYQEGAGQVTVTGAAGVTIRVNATFTQKLAAQYSLATLVKRGTNEWILSGDLEAV